jgi:hypothetical protein
MWMSSRCRLYSPDPRHALPQLENVGGAQAGDHVDSVHVAFAVQV